MAAPNSERARALEPPEQRRHCSKGLWLSHWMHSCARVRRISDTGHAMRTAATAPDFCADTTWVAETVTLLLESRHAITPANTAATAKVTARTIPFAPSARATEPPAKTSAQPAAP